MKVFLISCFMLAILPTHGQADFTCFVTSIKGDIRRDNQKLVRVGDTISYSRVKKLQFYTPGIATFFSSAGSFRAYTRGPVESSRSEGVVDFVKDILKVHGKSVSLSSRGECICMMPEDCLSSDADINANLLLFDTLSFIGASSGIYDSCFYFLQMKSGQTVFSNRLKTEHGKVLITNADLTFKGVDYTDGQDLVLGICKWKEGTNHLVFVTRLKIMTASGTLLKDYFNTLKQAMKDRTPAEVYETYYTDLYVFFGKPDDCRLKKLIDYHE
jgi:hypothetical protein